MGRGEPIRLAFVQAGLPFTNKVVEFAEFSELKASLPCGQLPVLEISEDGDSKDDKKKTYYDQSNAILRYVGKVGGLYPSDMAQALEVDAVIDVVEEAGKFIGFSMMGPKGVFLTEATLSKEEVLEMRKKIMDPSIPKNTAFFLSVLEKRLDENKSGWFVGDKVTIADLRVHQLVAWLTSGILDGIPTDCLDSSYPLLKANYERVEALPAIAAFRAKYGNKYKTFDYTP